MKNLKVYPRLKTLALAVGISSMLYACDNLSEDVVPVEETNKAKQKNVSLSAEVQGPVIVDLLKGLPISGKVQLNITEVPQKGAIEVLEDALLKYVPNADFKEGTDKVVYNICQGENCNQGEIVFNIVQDVDPCDTDQRFETMTTVSGQQVTLNAHAMATFCDDEPDVSTLSIIVQPAHGQAYADDGIVFYDPATSFVGKDALIYRIAAKGNPKVVHYVTVGILVSSDATGNCVLSAGGDLFNYSEVEFEDELNLYGHLLLDLGKMLGNDELCSVPVTQLEIAIDSEPNAGTVRYSPLETFIYAPGARFFGEDSFTYTICHNDVCATGRVDIAVSDFGCEELFIEDTFTYTKEEFDPIKSNGGTLSFNLLEEIYSNDIFCNDSGPFEYTVGVTAQPLYGTVEVDFEKLRYKPNSDFTQSDSFMLAFCNNTTAECSFSTVTINVTE